MTRKLIHQLITQPETVLDQINLVYVYDHHLKIERLRNGENFKYVSNGKPISEKIELERIRQLVIPPAWEKVRIALPQNGHLQAVGRDLKNRKQYRYHPIWNKIRNQTKFYRMQAFGEQLSVIRKKVNQDLNQLQWTKSKVIALVVRLMDETHIRIGSEQYAKRNGTYGLSTMRTKHVTIDEGKLRFEFKGKRGKEHRITIRNKKLVKLVNQCEEIPGWELFQFYDSEGKKHSVESGMVNSYLQELNNEFAFTAKDYRTWAASLIFFKTLKLSGLTKDESLQQKNILEAYDAAAAGLGNTRNVCKKYYVHPMLVRSYQDGSIEKAFDRADTLDSTENFSNYESAMLFLLKKYNPTLVA